MQRLKNVKKVAGVINYKEKLIQTVSL